MRGLSRPRPKCFPPLTGAWCWPPANASGRTLTRRKFAEARLRQEYEAAGKATLYKRLKIFRTGAEPASLLTYAELGSQMNMTESAVGCAAARLRRRFRELVREEVARTVTHPSEIDEEIRYLIVVISE